MKLLSFLIKCPLFSFHQQWFQGIEIFYENSPHLLHLMNVEAFRAFLVILMLGMRRSTDCKSMREYLNDLDCFVAIAAHIHFHLRWDCMENVQVREAKAAVKNVARDRSHSVNRIVLVGELAWCGLSATV